MTTTRSRDPGYKLTTLSDADVSEESVAWLWPNYIPAGSMGLFDGDPGLGKSMVTLDLAARITRGADWPDGTKGGKPGNVGMISVEDTRSTLATRLRSHGADFKRVFMLDEISGRLPRIPEDITILERIIRERKLRLLLIDPIMAFLSVTAYQDQKVREALSPLARIAEKHGCTIIFVRHMTKGRGANAKMAGGGSVGILGACRFGYMFSEHPENPAHRVMAITKFNIAEEPASVEYHIESTDKGPVVKWEKEKVKWTANDLMRSRHIDVDERKERDEVVGFVEDYMEEMGGVVWPVALFKLGRESGFTEKMLRTAKRKLGIQARKVGRSWLWVEPDITFAAMMRAASELEEERHLKLVGDDG